MQLLPIECQECGTNRLFHIRTWVRETRRYIASYFGWSQALLALLNRMYVTILIGTRLGHFTEDFEEVKIPLRSRLFIRAMQKRGAHCSFLRTRSLLTNYFKIETDDVTSYFRVLPTAGFLSIYSTSVTTDKVLAKKHFRRGSFPVAEGKAFWFWQKDKAYAYFRSLGAPVVVKPRGGSVSRHVTTDIRNESNLKQAIQHAIAYGPSFIIEQFIPNAFVHRATVIDFDFVVCVKQIPANVVGDGKSTIRQLIDAKSANPERKNSSILTSLLEDGMTDSILKSKGYDTTTIPSKGETVFVQRDPFLKLGGDLVEVTSRVHPDNVKLFRDIARHFDIRITGIDFLVPDITVSWKMQLCAILELNALPCIEMHHYPSSGVPTNPNEALADMFFKYYIHQV